MPINHAIIPPATAIVGYGGGFGSVGGWGRAFGETLINNLLMPDTTKPRPPAQIDSAPRFSVRQSTPKLSITVDRPRAMQ